jgi:cyclohexanecarboxylate-CoA ligase
MAVTLRPSAADVERYRAAGYWTDELVDGFVAAVAADPATADREAVVDGDVVVTHAELDRQVDAIAGALHALGVRPGDVVSWQLPNWWELVPLHYGIVRAGGVSNPILPIHRRHEVEFILRQAETKVFVHAATFRGFDYREMVAELAPRLPALETTVVVRGDGEAVWGGRAFSELLDGGPAPALERSATDPVLLMYTSGTTSDPKGVVHPHATLVRENRGCLQAWGMTSADRVFMAAPVTHITGLLYGIHLPTMVGSVVVLQDAWEPKRALDLIEQHGCTFTATATPFLHGMTHDDELDRRDLSSLRWIGVGGADVPPAMVRESEAVLGAQVARAYGSTEFPTVSIAGTTDPLEWRAETDGHPYEGTELRVVDDVGAVVPTGERGELQARGPERFIGYLVPPAGEEVFDADGWFATGDLARVDELGRVAIEGRKKDIILRGGETISVKEVEDHLYQHPKISEVSVVAMPDPIMAERACAFIVPAGDEPPTLPELVAFLKGRGLAIQKVPERLEPIDELPKNSTGKVQKFKLREQIATLLADEAAGQAAR